MLLEPSSEASLGLPDVDLSTRAWIRRSFASRRGEG